MTSKIGDPSGSRPHSHQPGATPTLTPETIRDYNKIGDRFPVDIRHRGPECDTPWSSSGHGRCTTPPSKPVARNTWCRDRRVVVSGVRRGRPSHLSPRTAQHLLQQCLPAARLPPSQGQRPAHHVHPRGTVRIGIHIRRLARSPARAAACSDFMANLSDGRHRRVTVCGALARPTRYANMRHFDFMLDGASSCRSCVTLVLPPGQRPPEIYKPDWPSMMDRRHVHVPGSPPSFNERAGAFPERSSSGTRPLGRTLLGEGSRTLA